MIKGCAFDVGNTLINDTRLVQDTLGDITDWLERKGIRLFPSYLFIERGKDSID